MTTMTIDDTYAAIDCEHDRPVVDESAPIEVEGFPQSDDPVDIQLRVDVKSKRVTIAMSASEAQALGEDLIATAASAATRPASPE